jgi:hypothetical protein
MVGEGGEGGDLPDLLDPPHLGVGYFVSSSFFFVFVCLWVLFCVDLVHWVTLMPCLLTR